MTIRILIADDHPIFRQGLRGLLMSEKDMMVVGEAETGEEAIELSRELVPDVVIMDIGMTGINGLEATQRIASNHPQIQVLILTMFEDDGSVFAAMRAGAKGFMLKGARSNEMIRAVRAVSEGEAIFSPLIAKRFVEYFENTQPIKTEKIPNLTNRELEILTLITQGCTNRHIAEKLVLSPKTVRNHISNILNKLQVKDRLEAKEMGKKAGLGKLS